MATLNEHCTSFSGIISYCLLLFICGGFIATKTTTNLHKKPNETVVNLVKVYQFYLD